MLRLLGIPIRRPIYVREPDDRDSSRLSASANPGGKSMASSSSTSRRETRPFVHEAAVVGDGARMGLLYAPE